MSDHICSFEHPIVFLFDYASEAVSVPDYDKGSVVSANDGCISIRVSSYVDGEVRIRLIDRRDAGNAAIDPIKVFEGTINVPSGQVSLVNSLNEEIARVQLTSENVQLEVYVDDENLPAAVTIVVSSTAQQPCSISSQS